MLTISELEKKLKEFLKAEHVTVLSVNGKPYNRFKMGYAVAIVKHNKTGEYVPMVVRMNVYSGSVTSVMLLERDILPDILETLLNMEKEIEKLEKKRQEEVRRERQQKFLEKLPEETRRVLKGVGQ